MERRKPNLLARSCFYSLAIASALAMTSAQVLAASHGTPSVEAVQQADVVKGNVVDQNGDPIIGATVTLKGTNKRTVTDLDGNFVLQGAAKGTLEISYT